ncbi:hypothetical protein N0V90_012686 [Kalmusia sp. IMI 367209]|nr:hypothetical protein N0V90_012686 [Kalmusia sp. IMI 367209]
MAREYGFDATKSQYERNFRKWNLKQKKRISATEWNYIISCLEERESRGKADTTVVVRGVHVSNAKIKKQRRNYERTTFERYQTRPFSQLTRNLEAIQSHRFSEKSRARLFSNDSLLSVSENTPWHHFMRIFSTTFTPHIDGQSVSPADPTAAPPAGISPFTEGLQTRLSRFEDDIKHLFSFRLVENVHHSMYRCSPAIFDPNPFLPAQRDRSLDINLESHYDLSPFQKQLELLKHVVNLISNNFEIEYCTKSIVTFTREKLNRDFLSRMLKMSVLSMKAVAEKLLIPAARGENFALVHMLLDAGTNINYYTIDYINPDLGKVSLLELAVINCKEIMVKDLLERGAKGVPLEQKSTPISVLATRYANLSILCLLVDHSVIGIGSEVFPLAVFRGDIEILDFLISKQPSTWIQWKKQPWVMFEAAASHGDWAVLEFLQAEGFDINATDEAGRGSPLVYALYHGHEELAFRLLNQGISIQSCASGTESFWNWAGDRPEGHDLEIDLSGNITLKLLGTAAIHIAIAGRKAELVQYLLSKGADANQTGPLLPLQLSTIYRDVHIARILLENGARPDAICQYVPEFHGHLSEFPQFWSGPVMRPIQLVLENACLELFDLLLEFHAQFPTATKCLCEIPKSIGNGVGHYVFRTEHGTRTHKEYCWNPLVNAINGGDKQLLLRVFDMAVEQRRPWITVQCLLRCVERFDWSFVTELTKSYPFPLDARYQLPILIHSIREDDSDLQLLKEVVETRKIHPDDALAVLCMAVMYERLNAVLLLLECGHWPDDSLFSNTTVNCLVHFGFRTGTDTLKRPINALAKAFVSEHTVIKETMIAHYKNALSENQDPDSRRHFLQAYGIAIQFGDMALIDIMGKAVGLDRVSFQQWIRGTEVRSYVRSSIHHALSYHQYEVAEYLLEQGGDPNILDESGGGFNDSYAISALQCASQHGNSELVKKLLSKGANVNASPTRASGATALQYGAISGRFDIVHLLLEAGADINAPPALYNGRTAIEGAAEHGRLDMVSFLLNLGADIEGRRNANYVRAVYRAWAQKHWVLARMIHDWKFENDIDYSAECHSIEYISNLSKPELWKLDLWDSYLA